MFGVMELRLIRHCVSITLADYWTQIRSIDPDSDESVELGNDAMQLEIILEKYADEPKV